jgi:hypothetical protein
MGETESVFFIMISTGPEHAPGSITMVYQIPSSTKLLLAPGLGIIFM